MSFGDAFKYPFKSLAKMFTIILAFSILIAIITAMGLESLSTDGTNALTSWIDLAQSLFLTGYGIRIVRHLMDNQEKLPAIKSLRDIGRGFLVILATILYMLPLIAVIACGMLSSLFQTFVYFGDPNELGSYIIFVTITFPIGYYLMWGMTVGMVRYAAEERRKALFEIRTNFGYVHSNLKALFTLSGYQILLGIIYGGAIRLFDTIYNGMKANTITDGTDPNMIILIVAIGTIISLTLNLFWQFSNLHFIYQFADRISIGHGEEKLKHDPNLL